MTDAASCPDCGADVVEALKYDRRQGGIVFNSQHPAYFEADDEGKVYLGEPIGDETLPTALRKPWRDNARYRLHRCSRSVEIPGLRTIIRVYAGRKRMPRETIEAKDEYKPGDRLTLRDGDVRVRGTVKRVLIEIEPDPVEAETSAAR